MAVTAANYYPRWFIIRRAIELALAAGFVSTAAAETSFVERTSRAQSLLSAKLITHLEKSNPTVIISPAGAGSAMAILGLGGSDALRANTQAALGYDGERAPIADFEGILQSIAGISEEDPNKSIGMAHVAILDEQVRPDPDAVARLQRGGANVWIKSLRSPSTIRTANEWVSAQTKGTIREIVDYGGSYSGMLVLSALYFKGDWANGFDKTRTELSTFRNSDGTTRRIPMMRTTVTAQARFDSRIVGISLPYKSSRFHLTLVTTRDTIARFSDFQDIENWMNESHFQPSKVEVLLPRLEFRQSSDLMSSLRAAGLGNSFEEADAFSQISQETIRLSGILQKVYFKVDEEGTEAAAATAIFGRSIAEAAPEQALISFDKPFAFGLRDRSTGMLLVSGYVGSISAGAD